MALWLIRSRNAEDEAAALKHGLVVIGFTDVANLGTARNMKEFQLFCQRALAGKSPSFVSHILSQLWAFRTRIKLANPLIGTIVTTVADFEMGATLPDGGFDLRE